MPLGEVAQAGAEAGLLEAGEQGGGGEQPQAGGGELEGEGEAVELSCDGGQGGGVVVGDLDGGAGGRGPVEQQGDGGGAGHGLDVVGCWCGQWGQNDLVLGAHPQRRPAGRHDDEVGAARHEVGEHRRGAGQLLEVVEHEEHAQAAEVTGQGVEGFVVGDLRQPQGSSDPGDDERRLAHRREVDGHRATGKGRGLAGQHLEREPGLADPARPGDRHQPAPSGEQCAHVVDLGVAPDERCRRGGGNGRAGQRGCRGLAVVPRLARAGRIVGTDPPAAATAPSEPAAPAAPASGGPPEADPADPVDALSGASSAGRVTASRLGTAATRAARSSSSRARPSARERTVCG